MRSWIRNRWGADEGGGVSGGGGCKVNSVPEGCSRSFCYIKQSRLKYGSSFMTKPLRAKRFSFLWICASTLETQASCVLFRHQTGFTLGGTSLCVKLHDRERAAFEIREQKKLVSQTHKHNSSGDSQEVNLSHMKHLKNINFTHETYHMRQTHEKVCLIFGHFTCENMNFACFLNSCWIPLKKSWF